MHGPMYIKYTDDIINANLRAKHNNEIQATKDLKC